MSTIKMMLENEILSTTEMSINQLVPKAVNLTDLINNNSSSVSTQLKLYDVLIPSLGAVIILLNLAVVISSGLILKKGQQPRATYLFLGNVAMTDLITGIAVVFGQVFPKNIRDHHICALQLGMIVSSTVASVYSVGLIAIDRYLYIVFGLHYQKWVYPTKVRLMILGTWTLGCLVGFLPLMGWYGDTDNGRICWFILLAPKELILLTVLIGVIPIIVVIILYSIILYHALRKILQLQRAGNPATTTEDYNTKNLRMFKGKGNITDSNEVLEQNPRKKFFKKFFKTQSPEVKAPKKWKAIKVVLFTTCSFIVTWCPYFIVSLYYVHTCVSADSSKRCKSLSIVIASPLAILGFANSLINPIIYAWWHKGFKTFVKKRLSTFKLRGSSKVDQATESKSKTTSEMTSEGQTNKATKS